MFLYFIYGCVQLLPTVNVNSLLSRTAQLLYWNLGLVVRTEKNDRSALKLALSMSTHIFPWTLGTLLYYTSSSMAGLCQSPPPRPLGAPYCLQRGIPTPEISHLLGSMSTFGSCSVWLWALSPSCSDSMIFLLIVSAFPDPTHLLFLITKLFIYYFCRLWGLWDLAPQEGIEPGQSSESTES